LITSVLLPMGLVSTHDAQAGCFALDASVLPGAYLFVFALLASLAAHSLVMYALDRFIERRLAKIAGAVQPAQQLPPLPPRKEKELLPQLPLRPPSLKLLAVDGEPKSPLTADIDDTSSDRDGQGDLTDAESASDDDEHGLKTVGSIRDRLKRHSSIAFVQR
jgi:hypothetical protein